MEDVVSEVSNGFFRALGYLLADVFFWTVCYWTGWPVCKVVSLGRYRGKQLSFRLETIMTRGSVTPLPAWLCGYCWLWSVLVCSVKRCVRVRQ